MIKIYFIFVYKQYMEKGGKIDLFEKSERIQSIIKICGGPGDHNAHTDAEIEEVDASTVETFTLEEFRKIILDCSKKNKDFVIARVTTPDPYDQSNLYNFYYSAAEINRILFKFESERRLLHRMKVRNPLNNMYILGQVYYYKITPEDVDKALVNYFMNEAEKKESTEKSKAFSAIFSSSYKSKKSLNNRNIKSKELYEFGNDSLRATTIDNDNPREIIEYIHKGELKISDRIPKDRKIIYNATYFATDDDFLMQTEVRDYFRRNTLDPDDEFLFEMDRTQNDFFALLEDVSEEDNEDVVGWKRLLTAHVSLLITLLGVCLLLGTGPLIVTAALIFAVFLFLTFIGSVFYVLFCRRTTFDTLAVQSIEDV